MTPIWRGSRLPKIKRPPKGRCELQYFLNMMSRTASYWLDSVPSSSMNRALRARMMWRRRGFLIILLRAKRAVLYGANLCFCGFQQNRLCKCVPPRLDAWIPRREVDMIFIPLHIAYRTANLAACVLSIPGPPWMITPLVWVIEVPSMAGGSMYLSMVDLRTLIAKTCSW